MFNVYISFPTPQKELFKVKMYQNLVSTIPAALFVSFLGPISDQVLNLTGPGIQSFWGGEEDSNDDPLHRPHPHIRPAHA